MKTHHTDTHREKSEDCCQQVQFDAWGYYQAEARRWMPDVMIGLENLLSRPDSRQAANDLKNATSHLTHAIGELLNSSPVQEN